MSDDDDAPDGPSADLVRKLLAEWRARGERIAELERALAVAEGRS